MPIGCQTVLLSIKESILSGLWAEENFFILFRRETFSLRGYEKVLVSA